MSDPKPNELIQAEELISEGKTGEALEVIRKFRQTAWTYFFQQKLDKALEIALQSKEYIEKIGEEIDFARNYLLLGWVYLQKGDTKSGLNFGMKCIELFEKLKIRVSLASSFYLVGTAYRDNIDYESAIKYFNKALSINEILPNEKAVVLHNLGHMYAIKGELNRSLEYFKNGVKVAEEAKNPFFHVLCMTYVGALFGYITDYDQAEIHLNKALDLAEKYRLDPIKGLPLFLGISLFYQAKSPERAQDYFKRLKQLAKKYENNNMFPALKKQYLLAKGLILKESNNKEDHIEAEKLFKEVITEEVPLIGTELYAMYYMCDLLVKKLGETNDLKIVDEIYPVISKLFNIAEKVQSNMLLAEAKVFQAKIELIQKNFDEAKLLLTQAQIICEIHNVHFLAQVVSDEHDRLLEQQDEWERLNKANAPLSERIRLASFDGILDRIQGKRSEKPPNVKNESPVFLLIITESGSPLFSYSFTQELSFEDDIISGFISAFNSFSGELFSKGLDRARFGDYIILLKSVESFSMCYLFKGQSYTAKQKLTNFVEEVQNNSTIWQTLDKFNMTSQVAELKDIPQIETLIKDIFIT
ncbi:MAG: tetratricopeptide repeat protein [Promethearchaeota archaeon]|jgi:tetratricopeptide (TPR) repeat protein